MISIIFSLACILAIMSFGCKKSPASSSSTPLAIETGTYIGKYSAGRSNTTIYQFKVNITKVNDSTYSLSQVDAGILTDFQFVIRSITGSNSQTRIKCIIPRQASGTRSLTGDQRVAVGYDVLWSAVDHSLVFGVVFDNNPYDYVRFTGLLQL